MKPPVLPLWFRVGMELGVLERCGKKRCPCAVLKFAADDLKRPGPKPRFNGQRRSA